MHFVFGLGRVQFRNLIHRQLRQFILRLHPIIHGIAVEPAALDVQFVRAGRNLVMGWSCNAHADESDHAEIIMQALNLPDTSPLFRQRLGQSFAQ